MRWQLNCTRSEEDDRDEEDVSKDDDEDAVALMSYSLIKHNDKVSKVYIIL